MIIGHYDSEMWSKGGVASYIRRISRVQRAAGHQVYYFSYRPAEQPDPQETPIVVKDSAELFRRACELGIDLLHLHKGINASPPPELSVVRTLHGHQPYCPSGSKFLGRWQQPCDRSYNSIGCLWGHFVDGCGSVRPQNLRNNFLYTQDERETLPSIPIVTVSDYLKNQLIQAGYPSSLIQTIHLFGPELSNTNPPPQQEIPHFVYLGRISPEKGVEWLIRALSQVKVPIHLDIAGEGYQETDIRKLIQHLNLGDRITLHGWVAQEQVNHLIRNAQAVVFPSLWQEPAGFIPLEAAAAGRAVICTRLGGIGEYVDQMKNAICVEPKNQMELASALTELATDWSHAYHLGQTGQTRLLQKFSLEDHMNALMNIYNQTIKGVSQSFV